MASPGLIDVIRFVVRSAPGRSCALAAVTLLAAASPLLLIVLTGLLVAAVPKAVGSGLDSVPGRHLLSLLAGFGAVAVAEVALGTLRTGLVSSLRLRVSAAVDERVLAAGLDPPGAAHLENSQYRDSVRLATAGDSRPDLLVQWLPAVVGPRVQAIGLVVVLAHFTWWAPVVLVAAAGLTYRQYRRIAENAHGGAVASADVLRRTGYFRSLAVDPEAAKEIRVFGLSSWVVSRMVETWWGGMEAVWSGRRSAQRQAHLAVLLLVTTEGLVLIELAQAALRGQVDLAALVIFVQAAIALPLLGWVGDADYLIRDGLLGLRALMDIEAQARRTCGGRTETVPLTEEQARQDVVVEAVRFAYPGGEADVLRDCSLRIPTGTSVAIVGVNGAGKSTLIKLLARLYEPDGGRITIGGTDIRTFDLVTWRSRVAVVFQDFVKYPLSLRANVGLGDVRTTDLTSLAQALDMVDGAGLPDQLSAGWDTVLSPQFDGGVDLSGGQWQKVALARTLLAARHGSLLVLDEPTASLDVRAEAAVVERILEVARGTTTVIVSHRFSTVRKADLIYVLDAGRVVEDGSHTELMRQNGRYATMFRLQAARFRDDAELDVADRQEAGQPLLRNPPPIDETADDAAWRETPEPEAGGLRGSLTALGTLLAGCFRESRSLAVRGLLLMPLTAAFGVLLTLWIKTIIDGVERHAIGLTMAGALLLVLTIGASRAGELVGVTARITFSERVGFAFDRDLAALSANIPGLRHHESPAFQDRLHLLRTRILGMGGLLNWCLNLLQELTGFLLSAVLLTLVHPILLLLPAVGLIGIRLQVAGRRLSRRADETAAADHRLSTRLVRVATSPAGGRELRVFNAGPEIQRIQREARERADAVLRRARWRLAGVGAVSGLLDTLAMIAAVALVVALATRGHIGLGAVLLAFMLSSRFIGHVGGLIQATGVVIDLLHTAERFRWLRRYAERETPPPPTTAVPAALRRGIAIEGVSFRYPGKSSLVLRDINLFLPAGSVVALVGENGAGKTTLVKLLSRCYEPTAGQVRIDGVHLRNLHPDRWRGALSAAFQDFVRFELQLREAVGVGDLPRLDHTPLVRRALDRAGASDLIGALPNGLQTQLGAGWAGGVDLSVGQWQKLALSRALMRAAPLLLVLDEPTASLDAETEHEVFERFSAAIRQVNGSGAITVLVSHRFSTLRMADLIIVLQDGRVVEVGHHNQLMAGDGLYAELFSLQAGAYR